MEIIKKLILINSVALCFVAAVFFGILYMTNQMYESNNNVDYSAITNKAKKSTDIEWLKEGMLMALEHRKSAHSDIVKAYFSITYLLPAFCVFYIANIWLLLRLKSKNSNKSSNLTGEKDSPSS